MSNRSQVALRAFSSAALIVALFSSLSYAATADRISGALSGGQTVALQGYVNRHARPQFDRGPVEPGWRFGSIMLQTVPTPSQQKDLTRLLAEQQDRNSPNYHKWLTPEQWADRFGLSVNDVRKLTTWLKGQGFTSIHVARGRNWILFSGTAAQIQSAFGTEIHHFNVNGEMHVANSTSPKIPSALSGVVTGIRGLDDFFLKPPNHSRARPYYFDGNPPGFPELIAPGDIATMYDIGALYTNGIDGTGQTLAVIGQTDVYQTDLVDFRTDFGLSSISCTTFTGTDVIQSCNDPHFVYMPVGTDPGTVLNSNLIEADIDIEWAGATAPNAQIVYVNAPLIVSGSTTSGGVDVAWHQAVDSQVAPVISLSYGNCEFFYPTSVLGSADETELMKANALGITFVSSSGDAGAAACDFQDTGVAGNLAQGGIAVSYPASSPEVTGVGGTSIAYANLPASLPSTPPSPYWNDNPPSGSGGSMMTNIPEIVWNDAEEWGAFCTANPTSTFCTNNGITNAQSAQAFENIGLSASGGGVSNCAVQTNNNSACLSGFPQPLWQNNLSIAGQTSGALGFRFVPDVALLASPWFPGYIICTDVAPLGDTGTGSTCANGISGALGLSNPPIIGGTSVATPIFAGMVALLNQYLAGSSLQGLGNINPTLYSLAAAPSNNYFHQVINAGNSDLYCTVGAGQFPCPSGGIIGFDSATFDATTGYNLVTGLGSVDLANLAAAWAGTRTATTLALTPSATQINQGQSVTFTVTITPSTAVGEVVFLNNGTAIGTATIPRPTYPSTTPIGVATFATTSLPLGANSITAQYNGDGYDNPVTSSAATVTVAQSDFSLPTNLSSSVVAGHTTSAIAVTVTPLGSFSSAVTFSCPAAPTGVTCAFNPASVTPPVTTSTALAISTLPDIAQPAVANITISATGGSVTHTSTLALTVSKTDQTFALTPGAGTYTVSQGASVPATINLAGAHGFSTPVTYTCSIASAATGATCTGPAGATSETSVSFQIQTVGPSFALNRPAGRSSRIFYAVLLPGMLGIIFTLGSRKRSLRGMRMLGLIVVLGVSTMWLGSCGGSNNSSSGTGGTPKGTYTVTINGTTGGAVPVTGTTTFQLTVQ